MKSYELQSGDHMPALGLGTWQAEPGEVGRAVREAIRIGYRHFDCAPAYRNEAEIGAALNAAIGDGEVSREELWITSKLWNSDHLRDDVKPALEKTLADLQTHYLDLYLVHWPIAFKPGIDFPTGPEDYLSLEEAPLAATWAGMEEVLEAGLCRNIGVSNFTESKINRLLEAGQQMPAVNQIELHPLFQQKDLLQWCGNHGIVLTAYSPLGSGGRPEEMRNPDEPRPLEHPVIRKIASKHDFGPAQVLISWAIQRGTSVIPKAVRDEHLRANFEAAGLELDDEDMAAINALDNEEPGSQERIVTGDFFCPPGSPYTTAWLWA
ncbi:MAG: aldo/keto reductase [Xanthomonadales bacterium]|nr:aldo/keto reductase [Xanthomonadales bacterium]